MPTPGKHHEWKFYGRRAGRKLSPARQDALDTLLPVLGITETTIQQDGTLDPAALFPAPKEAFILEVGFGNGERLAEHIAREPETGFIGAEPFHNGMAAFLKSLPAAPPDNIRVYMDDAVTLVKSLSAHSIDTLYVLNPDPWHKTRHHKRRIIQAQNLDALARVLKPGGRLILSTDVPDLAESMLTAAMQHQAFTWTAQCRNDWEIPPAGWIPTRYETKGAKGAEKMRYFIFDRT